MKKTLDDEKNKWLEALPGVLWSIRTTEKESTKQTPFHLVYGTEAVLPVEIGSESLRVANFEPISNEENMRLSLDLLSEARDEAGLRLAAYQSTVSRYYNRNVTTRSLKAGDLVLRKAAAVQKNRLHGKLTATWEGPYKIRSEKGPGTFQLERMNGQLIPHHWNADVLKKYFV